MSELNHPCYVANCRRPGVLRSLGIYCDDHWEERSAAIPKVWSEAETQALHDAFDKASRRHGLTETLYAVAATALRLRHESLAETSKQRPQFAGFEQSAIDALTPTGEPGESR